MITRVPRELGRPCRLHRDCRLESRLPKLQVDPQLSSRAGGNEKRTNRWYRQAKETKCGEMDGKESERLVVPLNRGNQPKRTPGREGDAVLCTAGGKHDRYAET
jgi:hypothetical protein